MPQTPSKEDIETINYLITEDAKRILKSEVVKGIVKKIGNISIYLEDKDGIGVTISVTKKK